MLLAVLGVAPGNDDFQMAVRNVVPAGTATPALLSSAGLQHPPQDDSHAAHEAEAEAQAHLSRGNFSYGSPIEW